MRRVFLWLSLGLLLALPLHGWSPGAVGAADDECSTADADSGAYSDSCDTASDDDTAGAYANGDDDSSSDDTDSGDSSSEPAPTSEPDGDASSAEIAVETPTPVPDVIPTGATEATMEGIIDADTVKLTMRAPGGDGKTQQRSEAVRLLGIDAPEVKDPKKPAECYSLEATQRTAELLPKGRVVWLEQDGADRDGSGQLLRYVWIKSSKTGKISLSNELLVKRGDAGVSTAATDAKLKHLARLTKAQQEATRAGAGLWGACGKVHTPFGLAPTRLIIPSIGLDAPIEVVGIVDGVMDVPQDPWNVGWYPAFSRLGQGRNVVMSGHVDWWGVGPTVFADLENVGEGDEIDVTGEDGSSFTYQVTAVRSVDATTPAGEALAGASGEALTLITCTGDFNGEHYLSRLLVQAERV